MIVPDPTWAVITISGPNISSFLSNLFTNIVAATPHYGALLNEKGRIVSDAFITTSPHPLIILPSSRITAAQNHLMHHALFTPITCTRSSYNVYRSLHPQTPLDSSVHFEDPRTQHLGEWILTHTPHPESLPIAQPQIILQKRLTLGIAEGTDIPYEKGIIVHYNFYKLNAISTSKGCYLGQELIARAIHTGTQHKNVVPITAASHLLENEQLYSANGNTAGHVIYHKDGHGIALCKTQAFGTTLKANNEEVLCGIPFGS